MELIIEFYKGLDALNIIIFWGIIIVIILLLIFSCILITKNKKIKKIVEIKINQYEELPIKKEELVKEEIQQSETPEEPTRLTTLEEPIKAQTIEDKKSSQTIEIEKEFVAEEHVIGYNKELSKTKDNKINNNYKEDANRVMDIKPAIELPTAPYQRNVLREMSLSQTSPIGINRQENKVGKKESLAKDLEDSLNIEEKESNLSGPEKRKIESNENTKYLETEIKKELSNIVDDSPRKTEIMTDVKPETSSKGKENNEQKTKDWEIPKIVSEPKYIPNSAETSANELLNNQPRIHENNKEKNSSAMYLEEVSRKLSEAEIPDEIERTNYELKQEEDAIISYKELMEKKDSIQTIDEEDAVISIEELMQRSNQKTQEQVEEEHKLYNLTEEEENDNFIKELKQFRSDL